MEIDEITIPSPDLPEGLSFGPVTLERAREGSVDASGELPVTLTPRTHLCLGVRWYLERYRTRGVFTVMRDRILFAPTAPVLRERAIWWRRAGFWILTCLRPRAPRARAHAAPNRWLR